MNKVVWPAGALLKCGHNGHSKSICKVEQNLFQSGTCQSPFVLEPVGNSLSRPLIFLGSLWASENCITSELRKRFKARGSPQASGWRWRSLEQRTEVSLVSVLQLLLKCRLNKQLMETRKDLGDDQGQRESSFPVSESLLLPLFTHLNSKSPSMIVFIGWPAQRPQQDCPLTIPALRWSERPLSGHSQNFAEGRPCCGPVFSLGGQDNI